MITFKDLLVKLSEEQEGPKVRNIISKLAMPGIGDRYDQPGYRTPVTVDEITHGYRKMSPSELDHARSTGFFEKPPDLTGLPRYSNPDIKWWSPGDKEGFFGKDYKRPGSVTVRIPRDKIPDSTAASIEHAEVYDKEAGGWIPAKKQ